MLLMENPKQGSIRAEGIVTVVELAADLLRR